MSIKNLKANNTREGKHALEEDKMDYYWFLKEKYQGNLGSIHLYCAAFLYLKNDYHSLGLLRDIFLVPGKDFVYALVKQVKTYVQIRYCLKVQTIKSRKFS